MEFISWLVVVLSMSLVAGLPLVTKATDRAFRFLDANVKKEVKTRPFVA